MKKRILVAAMAVVSLQLIGCSSTGTNLANGDQIQPGAGANVAIADQRLAVSEFKSQGIKVYYTLFGNVEAIEATGYAAVWGNSMNAARESYRVAELEAVKSLNDFINKQNISSATSVRMISENLEHAQDQNTNKFASNKTNELVAVDSAPSGVQENTAIRNNALKIASKLSTTITTQNRGIIGGLYQKEGTVIDNGRAVKVVMRWDKKSSDSSIELRKMMAR